MAPPTDIRDLFFTMVDGPSRETYLTCAEAIAALDAWEPYSADLNDAQRLYQSGDRDGAQALLFEGMKTLNLIMSPRAHMVLGFIAEERGELEEARFERLFAFGCMEAICQTGDGTRQHPYLVMRTSDEYDVLGYLQKKPREQGLVNGDGRRKLDRVECEDGSVVWFDITRPFSSLSNLCAEM